MITDKDIQYIANLSRIHVSHEEGHRLTTELEKILGYIDKLKKLDTQDIEPTSHVLPLKNVYRKDEKRPSLTQAEVLKVAVDQHNGSFKVPKVIE